MSPYKDITGQRFGRLTVIEPIGHNSRGVFSWLCKCDCGKESQAVTGDLTRKAAGRGTKSCGCLQIEKARKVKDLTNKRFGRLVVAKRAEDHITVSGKNLTVWECICDCGSIKNILMVTLTNGDTKSCGCLQKDRIVSRNTTHGLSHTQEYKKVKRNKRKEQQKRLDSRWTLKMEQTLSIMFPACVLCGDVEKLATDHVKPLSKGHGLEPGNAVKLCRSCNSKKYTKDLSQLPSEWAKRIFYAAGLFKLAWELGTD